LHSNEEERIFLDSKVAGAYSLNIADNHGEMTNYAGEGFFIGRPSPFSTEHIGNSFRYYQEKEVK